MAKVRLDITASCLRCDWIPGDGEQPDKAAERHTRLTGHATAVVAVPVKAAAP